MKKQLITLSVIAMSLLSGCAKSEAQGVFIKTKSAVNKSYKVKKWVSCDFVHADAKGLIKELESMSIDTSKMIKEAEEKGNIVALSFTFTTLDKQEINAYSLYNKKDDLIWGTSNNINDLENFTTAMTSYQAFFISEASYVSKGSLIKKK